MLPDSFLISLTIIIFVLLGGGGIAWLLREYAHYYAFSGSSRSSRITKKYSLYQRIFMTYSVRYSNVGKTLWFLMLYYLFCTSSILIICIYFINMFINAEQIPAVVHGVLVISVLVMVTIIKVSIPSHWLFIMFGKNKRKKQKRGNK